MAQPLVCQGSRKEVWVDLYGHIVPLYRRENRYQMLRCILIGCDQGGWHICTRRTVLVYWSANLLTDQSIYHPSPALFMSTKVWGQNFNPPLGFQAANLMDRSGSAVFVLI